MFAKPNFIQISEQNSLVAYRFHLSSRGWRVWSPWGDTKICSFSSLKLTDKCVLSWGKQCWARKFNFILSIPYFNCWDGLRCSGSEWWKTDIPAGNAVSPILVHHFLEHSAFSGRLSVYSNICNDHNTTHSWTFIYSNCLINDFLLQVKNNKLLFQFNFDKFY